MKQTAKIGLIECVNHELLHPYPVMSEKSGEFVAQFKYTVAIRKEGPLIICGLPLAQDFASDKEIKDEFILKLLSVSY